MITADIYYILFSRQLIFFIAGIFVSSCIYGLTITNNPKMLLPLYIYNPQKSFTRIAGNHTNGTYNTSYSSHKHQVQIMKIWGIISLSLLILALILAFV